MVNPKDIPTGTDRESIRKREAVISDFYRKWYESHPSKKVRNIDLNDDINVRYISVTETVRHAAISYLSTLAVLQLDLVLKTARRVGKPKPVKPNDKNQSVFAKMQIMECVLEGIGKVKLTVGIKKNDVKIQYCITAIRT